MITLRNKKIANSTRSGHVSSSTGGETFYYPNFLSPRDTSKLSQEIAHTVTRETGYQALMKVRCSNGLQVSSYHGNFIQHTFGADLELGVIDADKALGVLFSYDGKLDAKLDAHFQSALLYTTANGERRVRCCNVIASVSDQPKDCMKFVDQDAVYMMIAKEAASKMTTTSLKDIRGSITEKNVDILAGYRKNFSGSHPPGQLVLPENLKEFSMYMLGLIKSRAFKGGHEPTDRRVHDMRMIKSMGALELSLYLYPRMIPVHNLNPEDGFPDPETGHLKMPPSIRTSFSRVEEGGVYLLDNGQNCYLWIHAQVSPNLLVDLFGEGKDNLKSLDPYSSSLPVLETHLNAQVRNIMEYLKTVRGSKALTIQLARQGLDGAEYEFARLLMEDRNNEAQSYVDWLVHIHRHVQLEVSLSKDISSLDNRTEG
jgi:protein transport protein SEC24